ncbi:MAG: RNA polymerase sigma factor [Anaerolineales bacterium]
MQRVARGDGDALAKLYDLHSGQVFGLCMRILNESQLAEDVLQEVFVRVWERADTYETARGNFTAWLMGVTRNLCIDQLRRQRARPQPAEQAEDGETPSFEESLTDPDADVAEAVSANERAALIRQALNTLSAEQRQVIELSFFKGLTRREIARLLQWPEGTVHTRARLALQKLRQELAVRGLASDDLL